MPFLMARLEPARAPMTCPAAMQRPMEYSTLPPMTKTDKATTLLMKFMMRVMPEAFFMSMPMTMSRAAVQKEPVPGPKNPS